MQKSLTLAGLITTLILPTLVVNQTHAAENTWNNGAGNFLWDLSSTNWFLPTTWADGDDAVFGAAGAGTVSLASPVTVRTQTFNAAGYTIRGVGNVMTLAGVSPTITVNASTTVTNIASLAGSDGLTVKGPGTLYLKGDPSILDANHFTGGTYVRSGTLLLGASNVNAGGTSYAIDSIEALDAGATVKFATILAGTNFISPALHQVASHSVGSKLRMTGGTFDLNNEPRNQHLPVPEGTGLIINTGTNVQSGLIIWADGQDHTFDGVIADGGPLVGDNLANGPTPQGPGRQIGIVNFAGGISGGVWTLTASNTYSGSTRLQFGSIKLAGNGTIGFPSPNGLTGPLRVYGPSFLDLNGRSQTIALMTGGDAGGKIFNSAPGTVSTLTFGYGNEQVLRTANMQYIDNPGVGGILALTKIGSTCTQLLSGVNTYSGDTTVSQGTLGFTTATAVSPNTTLRLFSGAPLALNYAGTANVKGLYINGVQLPPGTYDNTSVPIVGTGTITVTSPKTWDNGSGNFLWDTTSINWNGTAWVDGEDAVFNASGAGSITNGAPITVRHQTFNANGYTIAGAGNSMTLAGGNPSITVNASSVTNVASIVGTSGLTVQGPGTLYLKGDPSILDANHFTGGTFVRSGTLLLGASNVNAGGTSYAIDSIEALDAGATVKFATILAGTNYISPALHQVASHSVGSKLRMTGGTFDLNNEPRNQHLPVPQGTGLIINTGTNVQSGLIIWADGQDHTFDGVIADGGPLVGDNNANGPTPQGPGRQIGIVNFAGGTAGGVWTLTGSNTYSGSTRLQFGSIKLAGNGTIGFPTPNGLTGPLRVYGPSFLDLNGRNQTIALMTGGDANGKIFNSATGTVSTLTFGYGNEQVARSANMQYLDNGGILAMTKIGNSCTQTLAGVNFYSGDTTVSEGLLIMSTALAVSPTSAFRLTTNASANARLRLSYAGTANVRQLWIAGVQQPNGVYGVGTPGIDSGSMGTLTVTGAAPATLSFSLSGNSLALSWNGVYKLQAKTNNVVGPWFDYPGGGASPVNVPINHAVGSVYFRLATY